MSIWKNFIYLDALKLGEYDTFDNSESPEMYPSNRPAYRRLMYIVQQLNSRKDSKTRFSLRSVGNTALIFKTKEGEESVSIPPAPPGVKAGSLFKVKPRGPRKKSVAFAEDKIAQMIAAQLKSMNLGSPSPTLGDSWFVVLSADGLPSTAFDNGEKASAFAALTGRQVVLTRTILS